MMPMSPSGYRLLGYAVSRGGKFGVGARGQRLLGYAIWHGYVRRRMPSTRAIALSGLLAAAGSVVAGAVIVRRRSG
jgi:hypothetical protein